jgi:hypothetical protein
MFYSSQTRQAAFGRIDDQGAYSDVRSQSGFEFCTHVVSAR